MICCISATAPLFVVPVVGERGNTIFMSVVYGLIFSHMSLFSVLAVLIYIL